MLTGAGGDDPALSVPSSIIPLEREAAFWDDRDTVARCLREPIPRIPPWFGYDERGSELFESITELPTYYLTRAERELFERHAPAMAELLDGHLVELGSGSAKKTRLLLRECVARRPTTYLPVDVSQEMLVSSGAGLRASLPELSVTGLWGRYEAGLAWLGEAANRPDGPVVVSFLGSNLGNTTPEERAELLDRIAGALRPADGFLVSVDLLKSAAVFETCYNDPPGHTAFAQFRLNHLRHLNRRFAADFDLDRFVPRAHYEPHGTVVEGHLYCTGEQAVNLPGLGLRLEFRVGDSVNVGFSAKFDARDFVADIVGRGFTEQARWIDPRRDYGIFLFRRAAGRDGPNPR